MTTELGRHASLSPRSPLPIPFRRESTGPPRSPLRDEFLPANKMADEAARNGLVGHDVYASGSGSSSDSDQSGRPDSLDYTQFTPTSTIASSLSPSGPDGNGVNGYRWASNSHIKNREGSDPNGVSDPNATRNSANSASSGRHHRPQAIRTVSNAYAPARRPAQMSLNTIRQRTSSTNRHRRNPNADYRAQERAYVERIRQDAPDSNDFYIEPGTPVLGYDTESLSDEESPLTANYGDNDPYDQETLLYFGNDDMEPSVEELQIPANRERLGWHSMLANVMNGDVVKQEKNRLIGTQTDVITAAMKLELWMGIRAKVCGRALVAQRRMVEDGRAKVKGDVETIIGFEIKGEAEVGKTAMQQVKEIVGLIDKCEGLYPNRKELMAANARAATPEYTQSCDAVLAWYNTTALINTELKTLQAWVGNEELDFTRQRRGSVVEGHSSDETSFIDRILKEDGLKSLKGSDDEKGDHSLLAGVNAVIHKAKNSLIANSGLFAARHLPPYIEELLTLINFPSRLIQEIIRVRLSYAKKMKDPAKQGNVMAEQMLSQFKILLQLAVRIKEAYVIIARPEPGWDLPPCIDENFDASVIDALKFYFQMLKWKLSAGKNSVKEAEILEQEWEFADELSGHLEGADVEIAEQFATLSSFALSRLTSSFEKELVKRPTDVSGQELDKQYKTILDSVRVRQRKLFRFCRILNQRFENSTEYNIDAKSVSLSELYEQLIMTGHFLVETSSSASEETTIIASPSLRDRPRDIESLLGTCYHSEDSPRDPSNPYVLIVQAHQPSYWDGDKMSIGVPTPKLELRSGRLRLVADGSQARLANANYAFAQSTDANLAVLVEHRANLPRVNAELQRIKKFSFKLSGAIMDSVRIIKEQTVGLESQELIQNCFAFATEFGQRSLLYMDQNRRAYFNLKMTKLALDWISFICDDCIASDRKTFRWAVNALEFAMHMTRGQNILSLSEEEYDTLRKKVAGCMSLLVSHFDIMGARSTLAAQAEKQRVDALASKFKQLDATRLKDDEESSKLVREQWMDQLAELDRARREKEAARQHLGRVLEDTNEADRALTYLSSSATNVTMRWQHGQYVGGGTFGSVYSALDLDTGHLMAVKEIRLQDPQLIPTIVSQIRDEMQVLSSLDHPNIVSYYGIEPHRDKVYIFMEYCSNGSIAALLEHGRIEDEMVILVYTLQMLEGLAYLHEMGIVHRDIKPENILLDQNGVLKYVDFGAAKVIARQSKTLAPDPLGGANANARAGAPGRRERSMTGTPMYMSPEAIKGSGTGARHGAVDIWSLGCVILEMATGRRPWASLDNEWAIMYNIAQGNTPQLPSKDQLSEDGIDFLQKCFERDPSKRASAAELLGHPWVMILRNQLSLQATPQTPASETSETTSRSSNAASRQNSNLSQS